MLPGNNKAIGEPNKNQQFQLNGRVVIHNIPEENTRDFGNMIKILIQSKLILNEKMAGRGSKKRKKTISRQQT